MGYAPEAADTTSMAPIPIITRADSELYQSVKRQSERRGISMAEYCRRSLWKQVATDEAEALTNASDDVIRLGNRISELSATGRLPREVSDDPEVIRLGEMGNSMIRARSRGDGLAR